MQIAETSQLSFDWTKRERSANRTDDALADIDVGEWDRAVIWTMLTHPDAVCTDLDRKLVCLRISLRNAAQYVSSESPFDLSASASGKFSEAVSRWRERGILAARSHKRGTFYRVDFRALADWSRHQSDTRDLALSSFGSAPRCSPVLPGAPPSSEGGSNNHSLNQSSSSPADLPLLPEAVWQRDCTERDLYESLREWWTQQGLADRGIDKAALIGAVLACRLKPKSNPQRYVEACLSRGVDETWLRNARQFLVRHRPQRERNLNPELTPAAQVAQQQVIEHRAQVAARMKAKEARA